MKSANWISTIGRRSASAMPIAIPTMPASASGVSNTRSAPYFSCSPAVTRNTPPNRPTSSPSTTALASRSRYRSSASLSAWIMFSSRGSPIATSGHVVRGDAPRAQEALVGVALCCQLRRRLLEHVLEERLQRGRGPGFALRDQLADALVAAPPGVLLLLL